MATYAYIGCRTTKERGARGKGISVYEQQGDGAWKLIQLVKDLVNPSYLCFDRTGQFLYTVHGDFSEISAFAVASDGTLSYINTVSTGGTNPVHLTVDATNTFIYVANLQTGTVAKIRKSNSGELISQEALYTIPGIESGAISHPHQVLLDKSGEYLFVPAQGRKAGFGQVDVFKVNALDGALTKTDTVRSRVIAEPRHLAFHPNNQWYYGVNEKDYTVTYYNFDSNTGKLTPKQIVSTLPDMCTEDGWASGIIASADGKWVVVSNRSYDSVSLFAIDSDTGRLALKDCIKTQGKQPRFITWDATGNSIWAANELSDTITEIGIDAVHGKLIHKGTIMETPSPVCVIFKSI